MLTEGNVTYIPIIGAPCLYYFSTSPRSVLTSFSLQKENMVTHGLLCIACLPRTGVFELSCTSHLCYQPGRPKYPILINKGNRVCRNAYFSALTLS